MLAAGGTGTLSELWAAAAAKLGSVDDPSVSQVLAHAGESIKIDGELVDCDERLPSRFMTHAWRHVQAQKAALFQGHLDQLQRKLSDILRAAFVHSQAGQQPEALRAAMGGAPDADDFDFAAMSRLVVRGTPKDELPASRRKRIEWALSVLKSQRFVARKLGEDEADTTHDFLFDNIAAAVAAYRERLPQAVELVKAIAVADLEGRNAYSEKDHDPFFEVYGENSLTADDLSLFPDYLVCIPRGPQRRARERRAHGHAVVRAAGQGGRAGDRPARGSLARHRALRLRRAQRAPGDHGHGAGRHVRAAGGELAPLPDAQPHRERHGLPRAGALQRLRRRSRPPRARCPGT